MREYEWGDYPYDFDVESRPQNYGAGNYPYQENWGEWANPRNWDRRHSPYYRDYPDWGDAGGVWNTSGPYAGIGPRGFIRSDDQIRDDINSRLAAHGWLNAGDINVQVDHGEVTLDGTVDSRRSKRLAEDIADSVSGVLDVHNHLKVNPQNFAGTRPENLYDGEPVIGSHGHRVGTVEEVHAYGFVLRRPNKPDVHIPYSTIQSTSGNQVVLNLSNSELEWKGWTHIS